MGTARCPTTSSWIFWWSTSRHRRRDRQRLAGQEGVREGGDLRPGLTSTSRTSMGRKWRPVQAGGPGCSSVARAEGPLRKFPKEALRDLFDELDPNGDGDVLRRIVRLHRRARVRKKSSERGEKRSPSRALKKHFDDGQVRGRRLSARGEAALQSFARKDKSANTEAQGDRGDLCGYGSRWGRSRLVRGDSTTSTSASTASGAAVLLDDEKPRRRKKDDASDDDEADLRKTFPQGPQEAFRRP